MIERLLFLFCTEQKKTNDWIGNNHRLTGVMEYKRMESGLLAKQLPVIRLQVRALHIPLRVLCPIANKQSNSR